MACEKEQATLKSLQTQYANVQKIISQSPPQERADAQRAAQAQLNKINSEIQVAAEALNKCQAANAPPPPAPAPANILGITPLFPDAVASMISKRDALLNSISGKLFPDDVPREWTQPLSPDEDYDDAVTSCTGWMIDPSNSGADLQFSHPFGNDWEFSVALDKPANAAGPYDYLLTAGNKVDPSKFPAAQQTDQLLDESHATALKLDFPLGLLGVEVDGNLVPTQFKNNVKEGDRVAVFGRWIIDTGHPMHRGEIHPPLLMAAASVTPQGSTKALFTSRPYLVSQVYTTDQSSIYNDASGDDGTFYHHLVNEIVKINTFRSTLIECHPKIKQNPMRGVNLMRLQVRPPAQVHRIGAIQQPQHLEVSYHFTVRTGVAVQLISSAADTVDVLIVLNSAGYKAPALSHNSGRRYSKAELEAENAEAGKDYLDVQLLSAAVQLIVGGVIGAAVIEGFLERGVQGDVYDSQADKVNPLSTTGAVMNANASAIPAKAGITIDDNQPYPVTGWVEVKWVDNVVVAHQ